MGQNSSSSKAPIGIVQNTSSKQETSSLPSTESNIYLSTQSFSHITQSKSIEDNYIKETIINQNTKLKTKTFRLTHRFTKEPKLLEQISLDTLSEAYQNQINLLIGLDHPNILKIFGTYKTSDTFNVIKDYSNFFTLRQAIEEKGEFIEKTAANIIYQILLVLHYLIQFNIIPINVSSNCIFVEKLNNVSYTAKFNNVIQCDGEKERGDKNVIGAFYDSLPPEYYSNEPITEKSPLWSIGLILYELLTGKKPYSLSENDIEEKVYQKKILLSDPMITQTTKACQQLLFDFLRRDPKSRISISEALKSKWFEEFETRRMLNYISDEMVITSLVHNLQSYRRKSVLQETAVSYLIHHMSRNEDIINATKLFRLFDKNNEGTLSEEELLNGLHTVYKQDHFTKEDAAVLFANVDKNNNGAIELKEFLSAAVNRKIFLSDDAIKFCFNYFDLDGNGKITVDEIETLFKDALEKKGEAKDRSIQATIKEIDRNCNAEISFKEFKLAMQALLCK